MLLHNTNEEDLDVPMTPMIDLVFLLLIFFLVTASLKKPTKVIPLEMPTAKHAVDSKFMTETIITIDADGNRFVHDGENYFNQVKISRREMAEILHTLQQVHLEGEPVAIRLDVDRRTQYLHLMDMTDMLETYGLRNVRLRSSHGVQNETE